jgi:uncharacterized protein YdhG (YjbR/CyaY superfamily)
MTPPSSPVTDYLSRQEPGVRAALQRICFHVRQNVPEAEQAISYGMPAYKYHGKPLIGFVTRPDHLSIHPFSLAIIHQVTEKLTGFEVSKGTIKFSVDHVIPEEIIVEMILARVAEIDG